MKYELAWREAAAVQALLEKANGRRRARTLSAQQAREVAEAALASDVGYSFRVAGEGDATELTTLVLAVVHLNRVVLGAATVRANDPLPDRAWGEVAPWDRYSIAANIAACQVWASRQQPDRVALAMERVRVMSTPEALIEQIAERPDDDGARLVLADIYAERDDPRGEFISAQMALERPSISQDLRQELQARCDDLLATHERQWLGIAADDGHPLVARWRRGFVEELTVLEDSLLLRRPDLFEREPITRLIINGLREVEPARFAAFSWLKRLRHLSLNSWARGSNRRPEQGERLLGALLDSRHFRHLESLSLRQHFGDQGGIRLTEQAPSAFPKVRALSLRDCSLSSLSLRALGDAKWTAALTSLDLSENVVGPAGAEALLAHPRPLALQQLRFEGAHIEDAGAVTLAETKRLGALRRLALNGNRIRAHGAQAILASTNLKGLTELEIEGNAIGPKETNALRARFGSKR